MMQSKGKITRTNAMDIIRRFAKEYRKALGKAPGEIIIVGGGRTNEKQKEKAEKKMLAAMFKDA